ncbi:uncharacterized protein EV422DRAFT_150111 [Fimicolochytrium jonesii]|uniref:uncharacterized protein n=1 Tax=Fimicolochytrium jonesii TaxID=1396493 RepID=UPI0022FE59F6|nr:uncharacterized protein EV422DRAFT_150111 [Fimicolochytrium jonesii]KAI8826016.1 hypothetical protein EV422DRAFT_150111 [Fimicolochytrium jonesii]
MPAIDVSMPMSMACTPTSAADGYRRRFSIIGSLGKSMGNSMGRSYGSFGRGSMTRDGLLDVYNFQFGGRSPGVAASPGHDLLHFAGLEDNFCKDFFCCGVNLGNLHDLLQHFEECHVRVESDVDEDEDLPFEFESMDDMDTDMSDGDGTTGGSPPSGFNDIYLHTQQYSTQQAVGDIPAIALADIYAEDYRISNRSGSSASAFDTSVIRKRIGGAGSSSSRNKKGKAMLSQISETNPTLPFSADGPTHMVTDMDIDEAAHVESLPTPVTLPQAGSTQTTTFPTPTTSPLSATTQSQLATAASQAIANAIGQGNSIVSNSSVLSNSTAQTPSVTITNSGSPPTPAADEVMLIDGMSMLIDGGAKDDRPYKCKISGCVKAYKNPGGLKYHMQHGHCEDTGDPEMNNIIHKPYQCTVPECGKRYKNLNGLKYHIEHAHLSLLGA